VRLCLFKRKGYAYIYPRLIVPKKPNTATLLILYQVPFSTNERYIFVNGWRNVYQAIDLVDLDKYVSLLFKRLYHLHVNGYNLLEDVRSLELIYEFLELTNAHTMLRRHIEATLKTYASLIERRFIR